MSEIVFGDVLAWEPRLTWSGDVAELSRPLSWAVTIHPRTPALPPMRGDELILVTRQTITDLKRVEQVSWADITRLLAAQPMAGLVVDEGFDEAPIPGVPLIRAETGFLLDAEAQLNRTITERRGELYRLGSDLARALSTASIAGADLDALFAVAGDVGHRELMLFDRSGRVAGRSRTAPRELPFSASLIDARAETPLLIESSEGHWLVDRIQSPTSGPLFLASASGVSSTPETARLVLTHTARAIEAFLGRLTDRRAAVEKPSRDSLLVDLLLGAVPRDRIAFQSRALGIDPDLPLRVAVLVSRHSDALQRARRRFTRDTRNLAAVLPTGELAVLVPHANVWHELRKAAHQDDALGLVRSDERPNMTEISLAARQARTLGRLWLAGLVDGQIVDTGNLGPASLVGLMLSVADPVAFESGEERLSEFAGSLLGALDTHDDERGSDLTRTLEGYLAAGGSTTGAADLLGVHRNTLAYRLSRISELTGSDLNDADTRLALALALKIRAIQRVLSL